MLKRLAAFFVAVPLAFTPLAATGPASAQDAMQPERVPAATLSIESTNIAAGVGITWGEGTLRLANGEMSKFSLRGLNLAEAGVTKVSAAGRVYNLPTLEAFDGTYTGVGASATLAAGRGLVRMKNESGVVIELKTTSRGLGLKLATEGIRIKLRRVD